MGAKLTLTEKEKMRLLFFPVRKFLSKITRLVISVGGARKESRTPSNTN
jgi:hypothetical protein